MAILSEGWAGERAGGCVASGPETGERGADPAPTASWLLRLAIALMLLSSSAHSQAGTATEYQVKAAFLYNFAKFVEWPTEAFSQPSAPFHLCVFGDDPFEGELERIVREKTIGGRPLRVLQPKRADRARGCHILFVASSDRKKVRSLLEALSGSTTLTVGDTSEFTRLGGMINFLVEGGRVRFEINPEAAQENRLRISAKLLSLARIARNDGPGGG